MRLTSPPPFGGREVIAALEGKVRAGQLDIGTALWQAASLGSAETLELVLQVPDGKFDTLKREISDSQGPSE